MLKENINMDGGNIKQKGQYTTFDFSELLSKYNIPYRKESMHYQSGESKQSQGWVLSISVVKYQLTNLLELIIPFLLAEKVAFKIPINKNAAGEILSGAIGYTEIGRVIMIMANSDLDSIKLAIQLIKMTEAFNGPAIPTDFHLGGTVYTRYGSFNPIILTDAEGLRDKYLYDFTGNLIKDEYTVPFELPNGREWPFVQIKPYKPNSPKKIIHQFYKPISVIKPDAKGNVIKALNFKSLFQLRWCIIKQGKNHMGADDYGRCIIDRLKWQNELHADLAGIIPLPTIFELMTEDVDTYLVMEFIKGKSYQDYIDILHNNSPWLDLPLGNRIMLLELLINIIEIVNRLHEKGYVHRDVTPNNFLITKDKKIVLIDLELAYSIVSNWPSPPFRLGTFGFMSPEQEETAEPTIYEDIYAIGGLMIVVFTAINPGKYDASAPQKIRQDLYHHLPISQLVDLIADCLSYQVVLRPSLDTILSTLKQYQNDMIAEGSNAINEYASTVNQVNIRQTIQQATSYISSPAMITNENWWFSKKKQKQQIFGNEQIAKSCYCGIDEGISGVMYLLAQVKRAGHDTTNCEYIFQENWQHIKNRYLSNLQEIPPGLLSGTSGIAIGITAALRAELLNNVDINSQTIEACFQKMPQKLDIATGVAGLGIAVQQCLPYINPIIGEKLLANYVDILLSQQLKDGSWPPMETNVSKNKTIQYGFLDGIAGIIWFMLDYSDRHNESLVSHSALKGLQWLTKKAQKSAGVTYWTNNKKDRTINPWVGEGLCGISLTYMKAFKQIQHPKHKAICESILSFFPERYINGDFTLNTGLSGLGEVYLEAVSTFNDQRWKQRAEWIAASLVHTGKQAKNEQFYWIPTAIGSTATADLFVGNGGIIHFLARFCEPALITFPLLPD